MTDLRAALRDRRLKLGLGLGKVASLMREIAPQLKGLQQTAVVGWEKGARDPTDAQLVVWAAALGLVVELREKPDDMTTQCSFCGVRPNHAADSAHDPVRPKVA